MPETQFLFFTKWQEQKRMKLNIDPYMLIQETRNGLLQNNCFCNNPFSLFSLFPSGLERDSNCS